MSKVFVSEPLLARLNSLNSLFHRRSASSQDSFRYRVRAKLAIDLSLTFLKTYMDCSSYVDE